MFLNHTQGTSLGWWSSWMLKMWYAVCSFKLVRQQIFGMKFVHTSGVCSKFKLCYWLPHCGIPIFYRGHRECRFGAAGYNTTHYWKYTSLGCCLWARSVGSCNCWYSLHFHMSSTFSTSYIWQRILKHYLYLSLATWEILFRNFTLE